MESLEIGHHLLYTKAFTFAIYMIQYITFRVQIWVETTILQYLVDKLLAFFFFTKNIEFLR